MLNPVRGARTDGPEPRAGGVLQDFEANRGNPKAQSILLLFRCASTYARRTVWYIRPVRAIIGAVYRVCVEWILGVELPWRLQVGPHLRLFHGVGLVVNDGAVIGADVTLRHGITIGHAMENGPCPVIGDRVDIGAGAIIVGGVVVGDGAVVGAGAVVVSDVPAGAVVVGNPARVVRGDSSAPETSSNGKVPGA